LIDVEFRPLTATEVATENSRQRSKTVRFSSEK
jgi:hypothetical protein